MEGFGGSIGVKKSVTALRKKKSENYYVQYLCRGKRLLQQQ